MPQAILLTGLLTGRVGGVDSGVLAGAEAKLLGEAEGDHAGLPVGSAGDVDGDGRGDLLLSAASTDGGTVNLVHGPVSGTYDQDSADARVSGEHGENAGQAVANALDINDDGALDLIMGAPGETFIGWVGKACLVLGPVVGDISLSSADATLVGEAPDDDAACAVAGPGDVDGDGWDDLLIGAPSAQGAEAESLVGDCAGDDIDEHDDEHGLEAGVTWLVLGPVSGVQDLSAADARVVGEDGSDHSGGHLAQIGDLDGDGLADLYVGAGGNCEGALGAVPHM